MSYASRRHMQHIDNHGVEHRIEIHQKDYGGSSSQIIADGGMGVGKLDQQKIDIKDFGGSRILKSVFEVYLLLENSSDESLLSEIFESAQDEFLLVYKRDNSVYWQGLLRNDLFEGEESPFPWTQTAIAKDLDYLETIDYPLSAGRETVIETIADILAQIPSASPLDIETNTSWVYTTLNENVDYLQQIRNDVDGIRNVATAGGESDDNITYFKALERILESHKLYIKQEYGMWRIFHRSAYEDPQNVFVTIYNPDGTQKTAGSFVNRRRTYSVDDYIITTQGTQTYGTPGIKSLSVEYNHRSTVISLKLPSAVYLDGLEQEAFEAPFFSTGDQKLTFSSSVSIYSTQLVDEASVRVRFQAGQYYYDGSAWTTSSSTVSVPIDSIGGLQDENGEYLYQGTISIDTPNIPSDASSPLKVTFLNGNVHADPDIVADRTWYELIQFSVVNAQSPDANTTFLEFELEQPDSYTPRLKLPAIWYADGPALNSPGALRSGGGTSDLTSSNWKRRGQTGTRSFAEMGLKEIMDGSRSRNYGMEANVYGVVDTREILLYRGKNYMFGGGVFELYQGDWTTAELIQVKIEEEAGDDFSLKLRYSANESTGTAPPGTVRANPVVQEFPWEDIENKPATENEWATETGFDDRYLKIVDETIPTWSTIAGKPSSEAGWVTETGFDDRYLKISDETVATWDTISGKPTIESEWATETGFDGRFLRQSQNFADLDNVATARTILDVYSTTEADNAFDNYAGWRIATSSGTTTPTVVEKNELIQLLEGPNVTVSRSGNDITISAASSTDTNWYLTDVAYELSQGQIRYDMAGGGPDVLFDLTNSLDNRYANSADIQDAIDNAPYDNYGGWRLATSSGTTTVTVVEKNELIQFLGGSNVTVSRTGNDITISAASSTDTNWYLSDVTYQQSQGRLFFDMVGGGSDVYFDLTGSLDNRYANDADIQDAIDNAPYDNYGAWRLSTTSGSTSVFAVSSNDLVEFIGGSNVTVSRSSNEITISASVPTNTNWYLNNVNYEQSQGRIRFDMAGGKGDEFLDLTSSLDNRYANSADIQDAIDNAPYDNYGGWRLATSSGTTTVTTVTSNELIRFLEGSNVTVSRSGNDITISASVPSDTNWYLTNVEYQQSQGRLRFDMAGGKSDEFLDLTGSLDNRYALDGHGHSHFSLTNNPHSVTSSQVGAVAASGGTFTGDVDFNGETDFFDTVYLWDGGTDQNGITIGFAANGRNFFVPQYAGTADFSKEFGFDFGNNRWYAETDFKVGGDSIADDHKSPSDRRIKTIIGKRSGLQIARQADLYLYEKRGTTQIGLMAQDMQKADSDLIGWTSDDEYGEIMTLSAYSISSAALHGVKEVDEEVHRLERQVERLQKRVTKLEGLCH